MPVRIALAGIYHESNTFIEQPTTLADFQKGHWLTGTAILDEYQNSFHEIGGMIAELRSEGAEIVPVTFAEATPGGTISAEAYNVLLAQMLDALDLILPVDGCLLVAHGAAVSEAHADMDGHWMQAVREKLGNRIPVVGTLDPHANVSEAMTGATDALIPYKTNPHMDQFETGKRAAALLLRTLKGEVRPVQRLYPSPVSISIEQQHTGSEPCTGLYNYAAGLLSDKNLLHIGINLGFPYADVHEMGTSFIVVTNNAPQKAAPAGLALQAYMKANRNEFVGSKKNIAEVLPLIRDKEKPVLLLDMGDNIGGGAPGNSTYLLEAFEQSRAFKTLICLHDPEAVARSLHYRTGDQFDLSIKNSRGERYTTAVRLLRHTDGQFSETAPRHGGQVNYNMGPTAVVETGNNTTIVLMSNRVPPFSLQQITSCGIQPENFDVLIAKGVIAPIAAYAPVCKTIYQVDTPGLTQANMTAFPYKRRRKPLFPFEDITT